jgi:phthalate 4,5-dioxygenase reductase subunit
MPAAAISDATTSRNSAPGTPAQNVRKEAQIVNGRMELIVDRKTQIADNIFLFELKDRHDAALPAFTAGAHVDVIVPGGFVRKYSLCGEPGETSRYRLAVKKEDRGNGGSRALVDNVEAGDTLPVSVPHNDFPLEEHARHYLLIAGGIGITPIYAMARRLDQLAVPYSLYYFTRTASATAFREEISTARGSARVTIHHDEGDPAKSYDLVSLLAQQTIGTHIYCCGPRPLMDAVRKASSDWPRGTVHFEDFGGTGSSSFKDRTFRCHLVRSGVTLDVPPGQTIVQAMRAHGLKVPTSCETGSCGTCKTALLSGVADHRDLALFDDELDNYIIPCVSRALSPEISIDA